MKSEICRKPLDAIVGDSVLCSAFRTFDLTLDVVHQTLHARLHAVGVLAGQQLRVPVPVEANATGQQLVELLHGRCQCKEMKPKIETSPRRYS